MKCAFTGHRDMREDFDFLLFERYLEELIKNRGADTFFDGMARGFDQFAALKVIQLKNKYNVRLVACIPFGGQIDTMRAEDRQKYEYILERCDDVRVLAPQYYPGCMYARNRYMVDNADAVLAHFHGGKGGTKYTVDYAKKTGKQLIII